MMGFAALYPSYFFVPFPPLLRQQRLAHLLEFAAVGLVDLREMQVELVERG